MGADWDPPRGGFVHLIEQGLRMNDRAENSRQVVATAGAENAAAG